MGLCGHGSQANRMGKKWEKMSPSDELHNISEQSLKNTTADPFMNLLFSFCEVILWVDGFIVVKEFSGKINLHS